MTTSTQNTQWTVKEVLFAGMNFDETLEGILTDMSEEGYSIHSIHTTFNGIVVIGFKGPA